MCPSSPINLRPYQIEAVNAIREKWGEWNKELLVLPTGCGKTVVFNTVAHEQKGNVLILAHRDELIEQARDKYSKMFGYMPGKIKGQETDVKQITVGSVQTMTRRDYSGMFQTVIVDEAHHTVSPSYLNVLNQFPDAKVLGVTATPDRGDKKSLARFYEGIAYEYSLKTAIKEGYLCNIKAFTVPLEIDMSEVKVSVGDFQVDSIAETLTPYLPQIADAIKRFASDRKTVVFCPLISIAQ
jgi:superfamily II DNA or RNA helicase